MSTEKKNTKTEQKAEPLEGEGSYTATHNYNAGVKKSVSKGRSEELAKKAKDALDGAEGATLRRAEHEGKAGRPHVQKH